MATVKGGSVKVEGLKEFLSEIKKLDDKGIQNELKDVNYKVAELVTATAKSKASGLGRMEARAAESLKPSRRANAAVVTGGGSVPFFGGAEFGAGRNVIRQTRRGPVRGWNQFNPWKGSGESAGYFLNPAIRDDESKIVELFAEGIEKIARRAFPD